MAGSVGNTCASFDAPNDNKNEGSQYLTATTSQAWAVVRRHAREIAPLRLHQLCDDNDRVSSLVAVYNTTSETSALSTTDINQHPSHPKQQHEKVKEDRILIVDLSRQRMTMETLNHLLALSSTCHLKKFITQLAWGHNNPSQPVIPAKKQSRHRNQKTNLGLSASREFGGSTTSSREFGSSSSARRQAQIPSMHLALRAPAGKGYEMFMADGSEVLTEIHSEWERLERLSNSVRRGLFLGVTGSMLRDILVIGRGVPITALKFVYAALLKDQRAALASRSGLNENSTASKAAAILRRNLSGSGAASTLLGSAANNNGPGSGGRRIKFLTTVDPIAAASIVSDLNPASTLVISVALNGNEETGLATKMIKSWLLESLSNERTDLVLGKHMMLVTGNDGIASEINKPDSVYMIPEHSRCEAFTSCSAATLLPLSMAFGWPIVQDFLAGAHDMDTHFVETNPRHNLPVLLALSDIWNDAFLGAPARLVTPFTEAFHGFPAFAAALEAQACTKGQHAASGGGSNCGASSRISCSSVVIDGGLENVYDRALFQSSEVVNTELVMTMDSQLNFNVSRTIGSTNNMDNIYATQDALMCSLFAQADELAFGRDSNKNNTVLLDKNPIFAALPQTESNIDEYDERSDGNRPSVLLICGKLDAFACGQLVALSEHRAAVKAHICNLDPFVREVGSTPRTPRTDQLKEGLEKLFLTAGEEDDEEEAKEDGRMNLSTKTILRHYANVTRNHRTYGWYNGKTG